MKVTKKNELLREAEMLKGLKSCIQEACMGKSFNTNSKYNTSIWLQPEEIKFAAFLQICKSLNKDLYDSYKEYFITDTFTANPDDPFEYNNAACSFNSWIKHISAQNNPGFKIASGPFSNGSVRHWTLIAFIPDNQGRINVVYLNSMPYDKTGLNEANEYITQMKNLGIKLASDKVQNLSCDQQIGGACGLSVATNIASIVSHCESKQDISTLQNFLFRPKSNDEKEKHYANIGNTLYELYEAYEAYGAEYVINKLSRNIASIKQEKVVTKASVKQVSQNFDISASSSNKPKLDKVKSDTIPLKENSTTRPNKKHNKVQETNYNIFGVLTAGIISVSKQIKSSFSSAAPFLILVAIGKTISNFTKNREGNNQTQEAFAESLYDAGTIGVQTAVGAVIASAMASPVLGSFAAACAIGVAASCAKPVIGKFTAKIFDEIQNKLSNSKDSKSR